MKRQNGLALVMSLAVLVVAALLGISSYQSSQMEERMAGNHRFSVSALQAAEAGVNNMLSSVLAYSYSPGSPFCDDISASLSGTDFSTSEGGGYSYSQAVTGGDLNLRYKALMTCDSSNGHVLGFSRGVVFDSDGVEVSARRLRVEIVPPGFDYIHSMLSNQNINITGNSQIIGNIHSNADVDISIKATGKKEDRLVSEGSVTANGTVTASGVSYADSGECENVVCAASKAPKQEVPSALDAINTFKSDYLLASDYEASGSLWQVVADSESDVTILPHDNNGDCTTSGAELVPPDNEFGSPDSDHVFFCPGVLTANNDFSGVTVMAVSDIIHNGQLSILDESGDDAFLISGGNIVLNGSTDPKGPEDYRPTYASFWSEGSFTQNGGSHIYGAVVAGLEIDIKGGIIFEARETGRIPVAVSGRLEGWMELESPSDEDNLTAGEA
ncbi:hypothetical protein FHR95_003048 [Halomonas fontilapidosi]|uniref:Type 4 fimbrial biogenesis protein PilX N-terminal domain-containing protein n=1 Tax=Halomonas fontilapidosi TaxID=616675 RepID=A0A7W5DMC8_9GAMM|nr:pilus assembly PilX N-terminal domain-containing protein [Halomonas fontilapidosi]MBB3185467.1 hypothetical protein [Halomonas fontilapidosi]